jgi:hypothetical protein
MFTMRNLNILCASLMLCLLASFASLAGSASAHAYTYTSTHHCHHDCDRRGEPGPQGPQGPKGDPGDSAGFNTFNPKETYLCTDDSIGVGVSGKYPWCSKEDVVASLKVPAGYYVINATIEVSDITNNTEVVCKFDGDNVKSDNWPPAQTRYATHKNDYKNEAPDVTLPLTDSIIVYRTGYYPDFKKVDVKCRIEKKEYDQQKYDVKATISNVSITADKKSSLNWLP